MQAAITMIGMVPGDSNNDKQIVRRPKHDLLDVYNRVLGVPELLWPILRYVVTGEGTRENILRIASVSHLWREVVCDILQSGGIPVYQFLCDNPIINEYSIPPFRLNGDSKAITDWDECFVPEKVPLGYLLPVGLHITESEMFRPEVHQIIRRQSERLIQLELTIFRSDLRLLHILESFKLKNLHSLTVSFPICQLIWPEDSVRTIQAVIKASPKLLNLSLDYNHCTIVHKSESRWYRQTIETKLESRLVAECSNWRLKTLRLSFGAKGWNSVFDLILKLCAPTIRELYITMDYWSRKRIQMPDTLVFSNLTTLRLVQVRHDDGTICFDLLRRFPNLKFIEIIDDKVSSTTLFDQFFPESMPMTPMVQALTYKGADLSESQCSRLFTCLPNCTKLEIDWLCADRANKSIRQITRYMTQLKTLEVYFSCHLRNEIAEHIDDWTFAGVESAPEVPKLERIRIYTLFPETLTRNIVRNVPNRMPTLKSLQILRQSEDKARHGVHCNDWCPECKQPYEMYEEYISNSEL